MNEHVSSNILPKLGLSSSQNTQSLMYTYFTIFNQSLGQYPCLRPKVAISGRQSQTRYRYRLSILLPIVNKLKFENQKQISNLKLLIQKLTISSFINSLPYKHVKPFYFVMMKSSISKPLCKFRQKCRNYKEKKQCKFSHANFTQGKGYQHNSLAQQLQQYAVNTQIVKQSRFQKPKNQTQCKFGMKCNKRTNNKCPFKHSESPINAEGNKAEFCAIQNKADILCRFGQSCTAFPQGICLYKHQSNQTDVRPQQTSQNSQADIFQKICLDFLLNKSCDGSCQKLHQFAQTKSISRLAQFLGCQQQINQIMVMYPYHQDQEPLFLIVYHNKISFAQLLQRQPLQCTQNAGKGDLVLKKCLDMDIQFEGQSIQSVWLVKVQAKGQRTDVIACKCNNTLKMVFLNQISYIDISIDQAVLSVISIGSFVVILFNSGKTAAFQYDLSSNGLRFKGELFEQKLSLLKKHNSFSKEVEIVAGFSVDNNLCFINKQLSLYKMKLSEQASTTQLLVDIVFFEIPTCLYALVLTSLGKIYAVNLLCFQTQIFLETNLSISDIKFSCLAISNGHLFIGIQTLGVLVYNMQKQKQLSGIIAIDCLKWKIDCGQSGTLLLLSENQSGRRDITIFKVAKLEND